MTTVGSFALSLIGFALINLSMRKHMKQWRPGSELSNGAVWVVRTLGYLLLLAAAVVLVRTDGLSVGLTTYCGVLTVAAFGIALANSIRATRLKRDRKGRA
ncbi:MAG: DUF3325 family protein [Pseudomonadota bacterium]